LQIVADASCEPVLRRQPFRLNIRQQIAGHMWPAICDLDKRV
jgi:hypothetical protein